VVLQGSDDLGGVKIRRYRGGDVKMVLCAHDETAILLKVALLYLQRVTYGTALSMSALTDALDLTTA
jgi:hypothetical protein